MLEPRREVFAQDKGEGGFLDNLAQALRYARQRTADEGAKGNTGAAIRWMVYAAAIAGILAAFGVSVSQG